MEKLYIIKIGGNVIDDPALLDKFLSNFASIKARKILVHGGGKLATNLANTLGIKQTMIEGRRVTDAKTLDVAVMVYAGLINKTIVGKLQALNCNAIGFSGADADMIRSKKRSQSEIDFGFVGDVTAKDVNANSFEKFMDGGLVPVMSPVTHDGKGNLLNTNSDSIARVIALAMKSKFEVVLTYCFEKKGVLKNVNDENSIIPVLTKWEYSNLKASGIISEGMIPKLDNAFSAIELGVRHLLICHAESISNFESGITGTRLAIL